MICVTALDSRPACERPAIYYDVVSYKQLDARRLRLIVIGVASSLVAAACTATTQSVGDGVASSRNDATIGSPAPPSATAEALVPSTMPVTTTTTTTAAGHDDLLDDDEYLHNDDHGTTARRLRARLRRASRGRHRAGGGRDRQRCR